MAIGIWNLYIMIFPDFIANFIAAGTTAGKLTLLLLLIIINYLTDKYMHIIKQFMFYAI